MASSALNQFIARATGGVRFYTTSDLTMGVYVPAGGGSWIIISDRNVKDHFTAVNPQEILLALSGIPIETWNYKSQDASIRHIGPMAQDFAAAFRVDDNDTTISTVDADGVALAAIQGLYQMVQERDATISALQTQIATLTADVIALKQQNTQLTAQQATLDLLLQRLTALEQAAQMPIAALHTGQ